MKGNRAMNKFRRVGHGERIRWKSKVYHLQYTPSLISSCSILLTSMAKGNRLKINTYKSISPYDFCSSREATISRGCTSPNLSYHFSMISWPESVCASEDDVSLLRAEALAPHHHSQFSSTSEHGLGCSLCFFFSWTPLLVLRFSPFMGLTNFPLSLEQHPSTPAFWVTPAHSLRGKPLSWASLITCSAVNFTRNVQYQCRTNSESAESQHRWPNEMVGLLFDLQRIILTQTVNPSGHSLHLLKCF